jgi:hypothetical protein
MKRLYAVLSLILLVTVLVLPAIARADDTAPPAPSGWTWDESGATQTPDGWTWDEA